MVVTEGEDEAVEGQYRRGVIGQCQQEKSHHILQVLALI